jgi:hypothetical protein
LFHFLVPLISATCKELRDILVKIYRGNQGLSVDDDKVAEEEMMEFFTKITGKELCPTTEAFLGCDSNIWKLKRWE